MAEPRLIVTQEQLDMGYRYHVPSEPSLPDGTFKVHRGEYVVLGRTREGHYIVKDPGAR